MSEGKSQLNEDVAGLASKKRAKLKIPQKIYNPRILLVKKELDLLFNSTFLSQVANYIDKSMDGEIFSTAELNCLIKLENLLQERANKIGEKSSKISNPGKASNITALKKKFGIQLESLEKSGRKKTGTK